jgi:hypothetical protein
MIELRFNCVNANELAPILTHHINGHLLNTRYAILRFILMVSDHSFLSRLSIHSFTSRFKIKRADRSTCKHGRGG